MKNIDHIGVAVRDMETAEMMYSDLLGIKPFHSEVVGSQQLKVTFFKLGDTKVELLYPLSEESTVYKFLEKKGPGIHHVAFLVDDIEGEIARMEAKGFKPLSEKPFKGALNKLVMFFHPKTTGGVLVELCQPISEGIV